MTQNTPPAGDRLRTPPQERFSAGQQKIDLEKVTAELRGEDRTSSHGHRQKTLYKHGGATMALFLFEPQGLLAEHRTRGTVTIHALDGHLQVTAGGERHELSAGQIVVLAPNVPHDVTATTASRMLLHVALDPTPTGTAG